MTGSESRSGASGARPAPSAISSSSGCPALRISAVIDDSVPEDEARAAIALADVLVRSPGVSIYKPLIQDARAAGKPVTTATALWMAERAGQHVIGVTGTKGKSTTATIIAHLLSQITPTELAGNIGRPVIDLLEIDAGVGGNDLTWVVCELSSYQIADLTTGPEVAVLTNLYREHTDWHGGEAQYRADKLRLFELPGVRAAVRPLGDRDGWPLVVRPDQIPLRGLHNAQNVATAVAAIEAAGFDVPPLPEALERPATAPHRLQTVHIDAGGTEWIDDSISTTPESTIAALEAFPDRSLVLIAGGSDRDQDYGGLGSMLAGAHGRHASDPPARYRAAIGEPRRPTASVRTACRQRETCGRQRNWPASSSRPAASCCSHRRRQASTSTRTSRSAATTSPR